MASAFSFDEKPLERLLDKFGIRRAWSDILRTHIETQGDDFAYLLKDDFKAGSESLEEHLILGLSIVEIGVL